MGLYSPDMPDPPSIAGANEAGVWANLETLGIQKLVANAAKFGKKIDVQVPIFDKDGNKTGVKDVTWDFEGSSDADATREDMEFGAEAADFMAKTMLDVRRSMGWILSPNEPGNLRHLTPSARQSGRNTVRKFWRHSNVARH